MNAAHYLLDRMRTCKALQDGGGERSRRSHAADNNSASKSDDGETKLRHGALKRSKSAPAACFSSVGSACHVYHGDDAVGYGPGYMVVADGVSGTMKASGVLARLLVSETLSALAKLKKRARAEPIKASDFSQSIQLATKSARKTTKRKGRLDSTISAVFFDETSRQMFVYTIGDCKCVLIRANKTVVFESESIIYDFNVPAVVSSNQTINYESEVPIQTCAYEPGDVCLIFSDGVHDNLFVDEVIECLSPSKAGSAEEMAKKTVERAKATFSANADLIPFAVSAAGFCREALEELQANNNVNEDEYRHFRAKCESIPEVSRPAFSKEKRVRQLAFYSASNLLAFAHKKQGKRDDISVCAAVLA
jgi:protein phosphatase PTC7